MVDVIDSDVLGMIGDDPKTLSHIAMAMEEEAVHVEWVPKCMPFSWVKNTGGKL